MPSTAAAADGGGAHSIAAPPALSPSSRLRHATLQVQSVNRVGDVMRASHERRRPRGMSMHADEPAPTKRSKQACCSARPAETASVRHRNRTK